MPLLCLLGHKVDPARVMWNQDICFGKCVRCGCDLVRSGDAPWQVPRGYRVVWREKEEPASVPHQDVSFAKPEAREPVDLGQLSRPTPADCEEADTLGEEQPLEELRHETAPVANDSTGAEAAGILEWPIVAHPTGEIERCEEPAVESSALDEEPLVDEPGSAVPDFMDVEEDDFNWSDVPIRSQHAAHA